MNVVRKAASVLFGAVLLGLLPASLTAADVSVYAIYKRQIYAQTSDAAPVLKCYPHVIDALIEASGSNTVSSAMLGLPNTPARSLEFGLEAEFLPLRFVYLSFAAYPDQKSLDQNWPNGECTFSIFGAKDGAITSVLKLEGDAYPAQPPHIRNFAETQTVDASKDFTLKWDPFVGGTTNDFCFVLIKSIKDDLPVTNTPFLGEANALDGTVQEIVIPGGTLGPGEEYDVYVRFDKIVDRNTESYPGAIGVASYANGTHFILKTVGPR